MTVFDKLFNIFKINSSPMLYTFMINMFLVFCIFMFIISKSKYEEMFYLIAALTHYSKNAWNYNSVYYIPLFILFLKNVSVDDNNKMINVIKTILFSLMLAPWCVIFSNYKYNILMCYLILIIQSLDTIIYKLYKSKKENKINC